MFKELKSDGRTEAPLHNVEFLEMWSEQTLKGQTCVCANNIMVHEDVHDEFVTKVKVAVETQLKFGDAYNGATQGKTPTQTPIQKILNLFYFRCYDQRRRYRKG